MAGLICEHSFKKNGVTIRKAVFCEVSPREYVAYEQERVEAIDGPIKWINRHMIQDANREYVRTVWIGLISKIAYEEGNSDDVTEKERVGTYSTITLGKVA